MKRAKITDPKPMKNILLERPPITGIFDSDWDGVPNDRDCVWYDARRHKFIRLRKKEKPSGLRYVIIESGKRDYCVVADKYKNLKKVFDGTIQQCQRWVTEQYKTM